MTAPNAGRRIGFQVAISDHRIVAVEGRRVIFRYRKPESARDRHIVVDAMEFIRRFLQHVLPSSFMKVRYYGFLNPNSAVDLEAARLAIQLCHGFGAKTPDTEMEPMAPPRCPLCGGELRYRCSVLPFQMPVNLDTG